MGFTLEPVEREIELGHPPPPAISVIVAPDTPIEPPPVMFCGMLEAL
jgi:hypothetical protein